ncbi:uncharacterized protein N7479_007184 [Penicillium vulpinum]|uniref:uncharacterized protein n=1 Tax=Penicillium vulpinum TaxID=29845 RepID=UPI002547493B|nr:uncharacterized protein N7479_007184 [Penicillium vulpinum]KAJ5960034.1 hypothetical protein N7479_007184 [Penicillium vulpinum]
MTSRDRRPKDALNESEAVGESSTERPPSYSADQVEQPQLELPQLNLGLKIYSPTSVTRDQCVAHLKLLAVFADLRDTISSHNGLFGLYDAEAAKFPSTQNEARARISEKRWAVYVARAADRPMATMDDLEDVGYENIVICDTEVAWSTKNLPPLDILMVWHSHMLNPRSFLEDSIRYGKMSTWATGFPWEAIDGCINNHTMEYTVSEEGQRLFEEKLDLQWDNLHDPPNKKVDCPHCKKENTAPWTEAHFGETVTHAFKLGNGYADNTFEMRCVDCRKLIDHGRLRVAKFRKDLEGALYQGLPMPGSFTNIRGIPEGPPSRVNTGAPQYMLFPTRIIQAAGEDLMGFTDGRVDWCQNISQLRQKLETKLRDRKVLSTAYGSYNTTVHSTEKMHFRKMMSRYWENLGPFALDLVGAVIRQGTFVEKMDKLDWLHSPTVFETMERLIKKYEVFFQIMIDNPRHMAVPTLDVDLAWHTHQLSPSKYYKYSTSKLTRAYTRVFIDHDDKVDEAALSDGFAWTSKMYRRATDGRIYSECTCWYCEATRAPDLYDRLIPMGSVSRARTAAALLHDSSDISSDPNKNPHISSHNAVRPTNLNTPFGQSAYVRQMRLQSDYLRAARRARKRSRQGSTSKSKQPEEYPYFIPYAYGYPIVVPYYGPYMMDPSINCDSRHRELLFRHVW